MNINSLKEEFIRVYGGSEDTLRVFTSPGRVNLIGEHIDYNGGHVFPAALTMGTTIVCCPRKDKEVNLKATDMDMIVMATLNDLQDHKEIQWGNYQLGVADELKKAGYSLVGCDMLFHGTIPYGAGLSSSASIEVATALALATLGNEAHGNTEKIDMIEMAKISQMAENNYVGVNCGIMDQFASAMGKENHGVVLDCKDLSYKLVPLHLDGYKIIISNTNKKRSLGTSKYNERRDECDIGLNALQLAFPKISYLCEITSEGLEENIDLLKEEVVKKRVSHVVYENERVLKSIEALKNNDLKSFGRLMNESHDSLRDLYEVSCFELDTLVQEALKIDGVIGSRMTGAGFGGCTVSIVKNEAVDEFIKSVGAEYLKVVGWEASFYISEVGDGGRELT